MNRPYVPKTEIPAGLMPSVMKAGHFVLCYEITNGVFPSTEETAAHVLGVPYIEGDERLRSVGRVLGSYLGPMLTLWKEHYDTALLEFGCLPELATLMESKPVQLVRAA